MKIILFVSIFVYLHFFFCSLLTTKTVSIRDEKPQIGVNLMFLLFLYPFTSIFVAYRPQKQPLLGQKLRYGRGTVHFQ